MAQFAIPAHAIAALDNAAKADVLLHDYSKVSERASDRAHYAIYDVVREAERRFNAALDAALMLVDEQHEVEVIDYLAERTAQMLAERRERVIKGAKAQAAMAAQREAIMRKHGIKKVVSLF